MFFVYLLFARVCTFSVIYVDTWISIAVESDGTSYNPVAGVLGTVQLAGRFRSTSKHW